MTTDYDDHDNSYDDPSDNDDDSDDHDDNHSGPYHGSSMYVVFTRGQLPSK